MYRSQVTDALKILFVSDLTSRLGLGFALRSHGPLPALSYVRPHAKGMPNCFFSYLILPSSGVLACTAHQPVVPKAHTEYFPNILGFLPRYDFLPQSIPPPVSHAVYQRYKSRGQMISPLIPGFPLYLSVPQLSKGVLLRSFPLTTEPL